MKKHLLVIAHPGKEGYCRNIENAIIEAVGETNIGVRDLYKQNFNPVLTSDDLAKFRVGKTAEDILIEQSYIADSDYLHFVYPIWWSGMPAILKGYLDRVFAFGFAYINNGETVKGNLHGKKAVIYNTHGEPLSKLIESGVLDGMNTIVKKGIFDFCGIETIAHHYFEDGKNSEMLSHQDIIAKVKTSL